MSAFPAPYKQPGNWKQYFLTAWQTCLRWVFHDIWVSFLRASFAARFCDLSKYHFCCAHVAGANLFYNLYLSLIHSFSIMLFFSSKQTKHSFTTPDTGDRLWSWGVQWWGSQSIVKYFRNLKQLPVFSMIHRTDVYRCLSRAYLVALYCSALLLQVKSRNS